MKNILIVGAGKSSIYLIKYMLSNAQKNKWKVMVADSDPHAIGEKIGDHKAGESIAIDINDGKQRQELVKRADIVISLMPPQFHILLAKDCLQLKKNLVFASYISEELKEMEAHVKNAGLIFMGELGLDPGIDHMTASKIINGIHRVSGTLVSFESYCGGLISPESDNNPWHYKFTWNPKNVVIAGFGGARYLSHGKALDVPYEKMFENNKKIKVDDHRSFAYYPNRDSMRYLELYDIPEIKTFMRATLRHPQFCKGWQALIMMGLTRQHDHFDTSGFTYKSWVKKTAGYHDNDTIEKQLADQLKISHDDKVFLMLRWLGLFDEKPIKPGNFSSADVLLDLLLDKWKMEPADKDMVVMSHEMEYLHKNEKVSLSSYMIAEGENREYSAMAKTVGLPLAIFSKLLVTDKIKLNSGIHIPNMPAVYRPVMSELGHHGITFTEVIKGK